VYLLKSVDGKVNYVIEMFTASRKPNPTWFYLAGILLCPRKSSHVHISRLLIKCGIAQELRIWIKWVHFHREHAMQSQRLHNLNSQGKRPPRCGRRVLYTRALH